MLRVWARQIVDFTPGRPFVTPGVRRTPAVQGIPRSRWLKTLGVHDQLVMWLKPKTCPSWLTSEALAALPEALVLREVRYRISTPGFRTREITLVTTLLDAEIYRVADLAELSRQRWQVESAFSRHKRLLGAALRSRSEAARERECYLRVLTHNLMLLAATAS